MSKMPFYSNTMVIYADLITHTEVRLSEEGKREHGGLCALRAHMQEICLTCPTYLGSVSRNHIGQLFSVGKAAVALIRAQYIILHHYLVSATLP